MIDAAFSSVLHSSTFPANATSNHLPAGNPKTIESSHQKARKPRLHTSVSKTMHGFSTYRRTLSAGLPHLLVTGALAMAWVGLRAATRSSCPVLLVTSQSMEPTFYRGDLILISNRDEYVAVGDIPVVWFPGEDLPFVHRAVEVCWNSDSESNYTLESVLVSLLARVLRERFQLTGA